MFSSLYFRLIQFFTSASSLPNIFVLFSNKQLFVFCKLIIFLFMSDDVSELIRNITHIQVLSLLFDLTLKSPRLIIACEQALSATYESINITTSHRGCSRASW